MRVNVFLNSARRIAAERGLQPGGRVQMVLANELMRRSIKRTPKQDGYLNNSRRIINEGTALLYDMPYARYLWYGEVMAGKAPKYTTGRPLTYQDSPMRGKEWVLRTMEAEKAEILQAVAQAAGGRAVW